MSSNTQYNLIKSYLGLLRSAHYEEKEMSLKYFECNKSDVNVYNALNQICENMDETNDVRIQALQLMRKHYQIKGNYLKFKIDEENLLDQGIEPLYEIEDKEKILSLPAGEIHPNVNEENLVQIDSLAYLFIN